MVMDGPHGVDAAGPEALSQVIGLVDGYFEAEPPPHPASRSSVSVITKMVLIRNSG